MAKSYQCRLDVRGYELDSFGHVNHGVYISYLEHARWVMMAQEGLTPAMFTCWQRWPVIMAIEVNYLKPTYLYDVLDIQTIVGEHSRTSISFEHEVLRGGTPVLRAKVRSVIVNEKGRPADIPVEVGRLWDAFPPPDPKDVPPAIALSRATDPRLPPR